MADDDQEALRNYISNRSSPTNLEIMEVKQTMTQTSRDTPIFKETPDIVIPYSLSSEHNHEQSNSDISLQNSQQHQITTNVKKQSKIQIQSQKPHFVAKKPINTKVTVVSSSPQGKANSVKNSAIGRDHQLYEQNVEVKQINIYQTQGLTTPSFCNQDIDSLRVHQHQKHYQEPLQRQMRKSSKSPESKTERNNSKGSQTRKSLIGLSPTVQKIMSQNPFQRQTKKDANLPQPVKNKLPPSTSQFQQYKTQTVISPIKVMSKRQQNRQIHQRSSSYQCEDEDLMTPRPVETVLIKIDNAQKPCLSEESPEQQSNGLIHEVDVQPHNFNIILERNQQSRSASRDKKVVPLSEIDMDSGYNNENRSQQEQLRIFQDAQKSVKKPEGTVMSQDYYMGNPSLVGFETGSISDIRDSNSVISGMKIDSPHRDFSGQRQIQQRGRLSLQPFPVRSKGQKGINNKDQTSLGSIINPTSSQIESHRVQSKSPIGGMEVNSHEIQWELQEIQGHQKLLKTQMLLKSCVDCVNDVVADVVASRTASPANNTPKSNNLQSFIDDKSPRSTYTGNLKHSPIALTPKKTGNQASGAKQVITQASQNSAAKSPEQEIHVSQDKDKEEYRIKRYVQSAERVVEEKSQSKEKQPSPKRYQSPTVSSIQKQTTQRSPQAEVAVSKEFHNQAPLQTQEAQRVVNPVQTQNRQQPIDDEDEDHQPYDFLPYTVSANKQPTNVQYTLQYPMLQPQFGYDQSFNTMQSPIKQKSALAIGDYLNQSPIIGQSVGREAHGLKPSFDELLQHSFSSMNPINTEQFDNFLKYFAGRPSDEAQLNKLIDREKNTIIYKYESLLEKVVGEYNKAQAKYHETQAQLANESKAHQQLINYCQNKEVLQNEHQVKIRELEGKCQTYNKDLTQLRIKAQQDQDMSFAEKRMIEKANNQLQYQLQQSLDSQAQLRDRNQQVQEDNHQLELQTKQLRELNLKIETEKKVLQMEIQRLKGQDDSLRQDLQRFKQINQEQEQRTVDSKLQLEAVLFQAKRREQEFDQLQWECQSSKAQIEQLSKGQEGLMQKMALMKEELVKANTEKQNFQAQIDQMLMTQSYASLNNNQTQRESIGLNATMGSSHVGSNYFGSQRTSLKNDAFPLSTNQLSKKQVQIQAPGMNSNYSNIGGSGYETTRITSVADNLNSYLASSPIKNDSGYFKQTSPLRTTKNLTNINLFNSDQTRNANLNRLSYQNPLGDNNLHTQRLMQTSMDAEIPAGLSMPKTPQSNNNVVNGFNNLNERFKYKNAYTVNDSSSISEVFKWADSYDKPKQQLGGGMIANSSIKRHVIDLATLQDQKKSNNQRNDARSTSLSNDQFDSLPAAGKRSGVPNRTQGSQQIQQQQLQQAMVEQLFKKQQIEDELKTLNGNGMVNQMKTRGSIEKRQGLEIELDRTEQAIGQLKNRMMLAEQ